MLEFVVLPGNPFSENTYLIYDETRECIILDPGCYDADERKRLVDFIEMKCLQPVRLINTHCHIDHVLGNAFVSKRYDLLPEYHEKEQVVLDSCERVASMYQVPYTISPNAEKFIQTEDIIRFGNSEFHVRFTPGHSPGSISLVNTEYGLIFAGDVLFRQSIGRTDLPGGDYATLEESIITQLYSLPNDYKVLSGHGEETTIGYEKEHNPFVKMSTL